MPDVTGGTNRLPLLLDIVERTALALFMGYLTVNLLHAWLETDNPVSLVLLVSEGAVVFFALVRRFTDAISVRPGDWLFASVGTTAPLLVQAVPGSPLVGIVVTMPLMLAGLGMQIWAKLILRRSFGIVAANRGVKVSGPYRLVRHPMYAGYVLTQIGFLLANPTLWNLSIYVVAWGAQMVRILAEERMLNRDEAYRAFALAVPYRLVPRLF